jgi:hypothetical protein
MLFLAPVLALASVAPSAFNISNVFGDSMVIQRGDSATIWGMGTAGSTVTVTFHGKALSPPSTVGADGVWRAKLPPTAASAEPTTISFAGSGGDKAELADVLFGDVFLCGGESLAGWRCAGRGCPQRCSAAVLDLLPGPGTRPLRAAHARTRCRWH